MDATELSPEEQALANEELSMYCRYLVGLAGLRYGCDKRGQPQDPATPFVCSGFLMSLKDRWFMVTAGHILRDMEEQTRNGTAQFEQFRLLDNFGLGANRSGAIPFDLSGADKLYEYDAAKGLDYAFITLRPMYRDLLAASHAIPITENDWAKWRHTRYSHYFMLGFQEEAIAKSVTPHRDHYVIHAKPVPVFIYLRKREKGPETSRKTKYHRFIGEIERHHDIGSIKGMSGGPIFGITSGLRKHGIVAIQSAWLPDRKITFGCPIGVFTRLAQKTLG